MKRMNKMRFVYAIMICVTLSLILLAGCEPEPEIFAMKKERIDVNTKKTTFYTNGMLSSESISTKNNGIDDVWRFYQDGVLVRIDEDLNFDGVVDKIRTFDPETGKLLITKIDANFDGTFEIIDEYEDVSHQTNEKLERKKANEKVDVDEVVTIAEPQETTTTIYKEAPEGTTIEQVNTTDEMIDVEPTPEPARSSSIVIEEDELPRTRSGAGSYFEPLEVNPGTGSITPARNRKIIPAPVFTHPSDSLED